MHESELIMKIERLRRELNALVFEMGIKFWVITEHDRSTTTLLLPEEY